MEIDLTDDRCIEDGSDENKKQDKNNTKYIDLTKNLQRCIWCSTPKYYDSLSLFRHNLQHLKVNLEKLPDEIFQFYEPDQIIFSCEENNVTSEINQYINNKQCNIKSEILDNWAENTTDHLSNITTFNKYTKNNNTTEFAMEGNQNNIEIKLDNSIDQLLNDKFEQLNKNREHNKINEPVFKTKFQNFFQENINKGFDVENFKNDIVLNNYTKCTNKEQQKLNNFDIKCEVEEISENSMDQLFDVENSTRDLVEIQNCHNSVIECEIEEIHSGNSMEQQYEVFDVENSTRNLEHNNNIESETKIRLQHFDGAIIKYEIEEIHSENSTDQFVDVESTKNYIEETNDKNKANKKQRLILDSPTIKSEIDIIDSENCLDFFEEENIDHSNDIDIATKKQTRVLETTIIKSEIDEYNYDGRMKLLNTKNTKKIRKNKDKANKPKKKPRQCHICKKFISFKHLGQHISEVHFDRKVNCEFCQKVFKCKKNMRTHVKNVHLKLFYDKKEDKIVDKDIDKSLAKFECDYCQSKFYSKDCLQKHIKNVHGKAVQCEICGSRLASEIYLAPHVRRVHYDDGKVHSCEVCGKIFKSPRYVRVHMKNSHLVSSKKRVSSKKKADP